jgi:predicted dehydrogenase
MLQLGWPAKISSTGGIYVQKDGKSNIADTQSAIFEYEELNCIWQHRSWGTPDDPEYPWSFKLFGEKGTLSGSTMQADFVPHGDGKPVHFDVLYEKEQYPEDLEEKDNELNAAPATRRHMLDWLAAIDQGSKPVADVLDGHISTASCILANLSMEAGRPVVYDPSKRIVVDDPKITARLQRSYRDGWEHPLPEQFLK